MAGTSGNRPGFKVFSFNTSVRNPKRNQDFLKAFEKFDGKEFDKNLSNAYIVELVKRGIYQFNDVPQYIKKKWEDNIELTKDEINQLMQNNPQATGWHNRVMTSYMRSLKDQGFLIYEDNPKNKKIHIIRMSKLGKDLIKNDADVASIYTKAMIGLHANNPSRKGMYNKSRPFLNTLFAIRETNKLWAAKGHDPKGIMRHEFGAFVLSMKDCDYKKAAKEIIKYRELFGFKINRAYLSSYLKDNGLFDLEIKSLTRDYPDDVFRKFEMTGLMRWHGKFKNIYYTLSEYNIAKVNLILDNYKNYEHINFSSNTQYYEFLNSVKIPWTSSFKSHQDVVRSKADFLGVNFREDMPLEDFEELLDLKFGENAVKKALSKYNMKTILRELMILSGVLREKPINEMKDIDEPLRLEFLLALALGSAYGTDGLVSNVRYNEAGEPLSFAVGGQADIYFLRDECSLIFEPSLQCGRDQSRNETTSVNRHAGDFIRVSKAKCEIVMIAPKIHVDTIDYFTYRSARSKKELIACTISRIVGLFGEKLEYKDFVNKLHELFIYCQNNENDLNGCADYINGYKPPINYYS